MRKYFPLIATFLVLVGVSAAVAVTTSGQSEVAPHSMQDAFSVLRTRSQAPPRQLVTVLNDTIARREVHESVERRMLAHRAGNSIWIFSTAHQLCLAQGRGASCAPKSVARREGVFLGTFRPPTKLEPSLHDFLVQGLVPNGVKRVSVIVGKSHIRTVPVKGNVFSVAAEQPVHVKRLLRH
jgi:hypothetical protein